MPADEDNGTGRILVSSHSKSIYGPFATRSSPAAVEEELDSRVCQDEGGSSTTNSVTKALDKSSDALRLLPDHKLLETGPEGPGVAYHLSRSERARCIVFSPTSVSFAP